MVNAWNFISVAERALFDYLLAVGKTICTAEATYCDLQTKDALSTELVPRILETLALNLEAL